MKRLTYDFELGGEHCWQVEGADNLVCRDVCERQGDNGCKTCPIARAFDRLAAIEDILGEEYELDSLREMVDAEKEGLCVVLPCKVGDTVYFVTGIHNSLVKPAKVEEIYIGDGSIALGVSTDFTTFTLQEGEWYLTRETAETALKAREQDE